MSLPRLRSIRLTYGCHDRRFDLPDEDRPVVIAGPNGSGKTSLLEALLRGLYGFSRRKPEEREWLALRHPWSGKPPTAEIDLTSVGGEAIRVARDFSTDHVVAQRLDADVELFRGDANPVGERSENRRYRQLVGEWIGFSRLEPYRKTAWIGQGELVETGLDDELLRAAAGTHRRVEAALDELQQAFDELTRDPIALGGARKTRDRTLELLRSAAGDLSGRLDTARSAREGRRPLRETAVRTAGRMKQVEGEIGLLEEALRPLSERRTLVAEEGRERDRLSALTEALEWIADAGRVAEAAAGEAEAAGSDGVYPADLEARLGRAEVLWQRRRTLEAELHSIPEDVPEPAPGRPFAWTRSAPAGAGAVLLVGALALFVLGFGGPGTAAALGGAALLAAAAWRAWRVSPRGPRRSAVERLRAELADVEDRLSSLADGLPGPALSPDSFSAHRQRFRRQTAARDALKVARDRLDEAMVRASRVLPGASAGSPAWSDATTARRRLAEEQEAARTALARAQLRLEEQPAVPELPDGVEPTVPAVEAARTTLRQERRELAAEQTRLELELRDMERVSEDAYVLERELSRVRERVTEVESEAAVCRLAWELVRDAYAEFQDRDQERLLRSVNAHLETLSGGRLGPIETDGDLKASEIRLDGRRVALESPPLSYGEKHLALFAIRLGAADFLAGDGVHHPLLVDEPFTHLDEMRSAEVWDLLCSVARERQVIVTTQARLVLDHLGVTPDIQLALPEPASDPPIVQSASPVAELVIPPGEGATGGRPEGPGEEPGPTSNPPAAEQAQLELG